MEHDDEHINTDFGVTWAARAQGASCCLVELVVHCCDCNTLADRCSV
jgi:hypothetical protein